MEEFVLTEVKDEIREKIKKFLQFHLEKNNRVVLITSGGTTVPLEEKTVRFIDNFSIGTRGSISAEYFLKQSYAVLYLYRRRSLAPFERNFNHLNILDLIKYSDDSHETFKIESKSFNINDLLDTYTKVKENNLLLKIEFTSIFDYLSLLEFSSRSLECLKTNSLVYLAAAVSDFYLPKSEMPKHKIQSNQTGGLELKLKPVPKLLGNLKLDWCPKAFVASFKLETDPNLLYAKCKQSLDRYKHELVIGNILEERKNNVFIMQSNGKIDLINLEKPGGEIEEQIVEFIVDLHTNYINLIE